MRSSLTCLGFLAAHALKRANAPRVETGLAKISTSAFLEVAFAHLAALGLRNVRDPRPPAVTGCPDPTFADKFLCRE